MNDHDFYRAIYGAPAPLPATKATSPFLVFCDSPGARAPTFKHNSRAAAEAEARRLSELTPGKTFYVLGALSYTHTPKPTPVTARTMSLV